MKITWLGFIIILFYSLAESIFAQGKVVDCLGVKVSKDDDTAVYSSLKPWIDTAQDTAHFSQYWIDCKSPPGCSPFLNCTSLEGCKPLRIGGGIHATLINGNLSLQEMKTLYDIWAADLNSEFKLKQVDSFVPFVTKPLLVDSTLGYTFGPFPWLSKSEILALSKKCYVSYIGLNLQQPVSIKQFGTKNGLDKKNLTERIHVNAKGQHTELNRPGIYYRPLKLLQ